MCDITQKLDEMLDFNVNINFLIFHLCEHKSVLDTNVCWVNEHI
jgi:hypothetical protein